MTLPRASKLALIMPASRARELVAPDRPTFSDPARSTRLSLPTLRTSAPSFELSRTWTLIVKIECERLVGVMTIRRSQ